MKFKTIKINKWQQFENVEIDFHERLTVITGANGCGKTTILNILAKHFGWDVQPLATPAMDIENKIWKWLTGIFTNDSNKQNKRGEIEYSNGVKANIIIPQQVGPQYSIEIQNRQHTDCFFIPSHRSIFRYHVLNSIPTHGTIDKGQAFNKVSNSSKNRYFGSGDQSSSFYMKETLVTWNIFGRGNEDMVPNEKLLEYYKGFEETLKTVLPTELGFKKFVVRNFEIVLECDSGDFIIDAASGGISSIIDFAWQIYMYAADKKDGFTVLIDEVENHLHPTMQRRILPDFVKAFRNVSFIVSTHSPLIVGSVKDSNVYILQFNKEKKVITQKLDLVNKAKTATEILDEVLGVSFTMPVWAEEKLIEIVQRYAKTDATERVFNDMRKELSQIGLERLIPEAITNLIKEKDAKN